MGEVVGLLQQGRDWLADGRPGSVEIVSGVILFLLFRPCRANEARSGGLLFHDLREVLLPILGTGFLYWYRCFFLLIINFLLLRFFFSLLYPVALPTVQWISLALVVALLGCLSRKPLRVFLFRITRWLSWMYRRSFIYLILACSALFMAVYLTSLSSRNPLADAEYLLSSGNEVLIDGRSDGNENNDKWFFPQSPDPWLSTCQQYFYLKRQHKYAEYAAKCPQDSEARIYVNNDEASGLHRATPDSILLNVAVTVPVSREDGNGVYPSMEFFRGVAHAQREINQGGGLNLNQGQAFMRMMLIDDGRYDKSKGAEAVEAQRVASYIANKARQERLFAVMGPVTSDAAEAVGPIYQAAQLVAISPSSTSPRVNGIRRLFSLLPRGIRQFFSEDLYLSSNVFRVAPNDYIAFAELRDYIRSYNQSRVGDAGKGISSLVVVSESGNRYGEIYKDLFRREADDQSVKVLNSLVPGQDQCSVTPSSKPSVLACKKFIRSSLGKVDAVLFVPPAKSSPLFSDFADDDIVLKGGVKIFGSDSMYNESWLKKRFVGMVVFAPGRRLGERRESWRTVMAYDAINALAKGAEIASSSPACRSIHAHDSVYRNDELFISCLRRELSAVFLNPAFAARGGLGDATVQFDSDGDRATPRRYRDSLKARYCVRHRDGKIDFDELKADELCP